MDIVSILKAGFMAALGPHRDLRRPRLISKYSSSHVRRFYLVPILFIFMIENKLLDNKRLKR